MAIDCLRLRLWNDPTVHYWYRQNTLMYVREEVLERYPKLAELRRATPWGALPLVHPALYIPDAAFHRHMGLRDATKQWFHVFIRALKKRFLRIWRPGHQPSPLSLPPRPLGAPLDVSASNRGS